MNAQDLQDLQTAFPNAMIVRFITVPVRADFIESGELYLLTDSNAEIANKFFNCPVYVFKSVHDLVAQAASCGNSETGVYWDMFSMLMWTGRRLNGQARSFHFRIEKIGLVHLVASVHKSEVDDPAPVLDIMTMAEWEKIQECTQSD